MQFRRLSSRCVLALGIVFERALNNDDDGGDLPEVLLSSLEECTRALALSVQKAHLTFPKRTPDDDRRRPAA
jgi:hypothetical protein